MNDDLISRQSIIYKLYAKANEWRGSYSGDAYATAARMVKKEPAVDVVEVVRCKNCVSGHKQPYSTLIRCETMACNGLKPDDFCSYGERRTDDGT